MIKENFAKPSRGHAGFVGCDLNKVDLHHNDLPGELLSETTSH